MEHVPPPAREQVVCEVLRAARKVVVFGYPCGPAAFELDQRLYRDYQSRKFLAPSWLEEHMLHTFPDENLCGELPEGWKRMVIPNESLPFHYGMMKTEMFRPWDYSFRLALWVVPGVVERVLRRFDREPSYREIFILTRESYAAYT